MKYTEEMILQSPSGYCMPFEEEKNKEVTLSKGYGEQKDAVTRETSFHHGINFHASHRPLAAVASGVVSSIGTDKEHGVYIVIRYGKYEVTYAHLANIFIRFGQKVKAGQTVAISGNDLHMEVAFDGEELNPIEFLTCFTVISRHSANRDTVRHTSSLRLTVRLKPGTTVTRRKSRN